jgi:hypothetical protein
MDVFPESMEICRTIRKEVDCPSLKLTRQLTDECPEFMEICLEGPITIFADKSWEDDGNGLENILPHSFFLVSDKQLEQEK